MADIEKPTLKDIAKATYDFCENLEDLEEELLHDQSGLDNKGKHKDGSPIEEAESTEVKPESTEKLLNRISDLLCELYGLKQMASRNRHPSLFQIDESVNYAYSRCYWRLLIDEFSKTLEAVLFDAIEAQERLEEIWEEKMGEPPEGFVTPRQAILLPWSHAPYSDLRYKSERVLGSFDGIIEQLQIETGKIAGFGVRENDEKPQLTFKVPTSGEHTRTQEKADSSLLKLSRQLFAIHSSLICYEDFLAECLKEEYLSNKEYLDDKKDTLEYGIELFDDICSAKQTAIKCFIPSAQKASCILYKLGNCIEESLRKFDLSRHIGEHSNQPNKDSRSILLKDIFRIDTDWFVAIDEIAKETSGDYVMLESKQDVTETNSNDDVEIETISPEHKSVPLSLTQMATYWGGQMTAKKLRTMIKNGHIKCERINRQTYVFDTSKMPDFVRNKVRKK